MPFCIILPQAASNGKYVALCLEMHVRNFIPPYHLLDLFWNSPAWGLHKKDQVLSRWHAALKDIAVLVPFANLRLCPIVIQRMPNAFSNEPVSAIYTWHKSLSNICVLNATQYWCSSCLDELYRFMSVCINSALSAPELSSIFIYLIRDKLHFTALKKKNLRPLLDSFEDLRQSLK